MLWVQDLSIHVMRMVDFSTITEFDTIWFTHFIDYYFFFID